MFLYPYSSHPVQFADSPTWTSENRLTFTTTQSELQNNNRSLLGLVVGENGKPAQTLIELGNVSTQITSTSPTLPTLNSMQQPTTVSHELISSPQDQKPDLGFIIESANVTAFGVKEACKTCGEDVLQHELIQHMRNHMGPRRCEICNYEAPTKHHLREHMNTHTGLKPYKCNFCDKCFAAKNSLRVHTMYLHTKVRAHQCHHCDQRFVTTSERKSHELVHTDKCPICQMSFRLRGHLRQHMKIHANAAFHHKKR